MQTFCHAVSSLWVFIFPFRFLSPFWDLFALSLDFFWISEWEIGFGIGFAEAFVGRISFLGPLADSREEEAGEEFLILFSFRFRGNVCSAAADDRIRAPAPSAVPEATGQNH